MTDKVVNGLLLSHKALINDLFIMNKPLVTTYSPFLKHVLSESGTGNGNSGVLG